MENISNLRLQIEKWQNKKNKNKIQKQIYKTARASSWSKRNLTIK